jgi:glycine/D-amino acid oxidase-like deaminating enzyme
MKVAPHLGACVFSNVAVLEPQQIMRGDSGDMKLIYRPVPFPREFRFLFGAPCLFSIPVIKWQRDRSSDTLRDDSAPSTNTKTIRIGIVGGGICGTTVAYSLAKKLLSTKKDARLKNNYKITVLEGDPHSPATTSLASLEAKKKSPPQWTAATARNGNSIVPGASMHVFSVPSVLWEVIQDTVKEWYFMKRRLLQNSLLFTESVAVSQQNDFTKRPPYFALHLWKCVGPSASYEERWAFARFVKQFIYATFAMGEKAAAERGHYMCQLAKANREIFLKEAADLNAQGYEVKYTHGFLALYRSLNAANLALEETLKHQEKACLLEWDDALKKEPRLHNLPMKPLFAIHRPDDIISSCEDFFHAQTQMVRTLGVDIQGLSQVAQVEVVQEIGSNANGRVANARDLVYRVTCKNGTTYDFDILVLAAGVYTPLLASQLDVAEYVPSYPLRGFSLTTIVGSKGGNGNLLKQAFAVDSMYCSSVDPWMARWAGFGEFVGYPGKDTQVPSTAPAVLSRYTKAVFPDALNGTVQDALWCYRPLSPDDLPIAGAIPKLPGLFVHTGHGKKRYVMSI